MVSSLDGEVDDRILLEAYERLYRGPDWRPGYSELADLRRCDMRQVTADGLRRLSRLAQSAVGDAAVSFRTAVVVEDDLPFGLARMYGTFADTLAEDVQVFRDEGEAIEWLAVPEEARAAVLAELAERSGREGGSTGT